MLNLIALLCIAFTFIPVSRWLRVRLDDLVYAQRDDPYALPSIINQQLRGMQNPQLALPRVVKTMGSMLQTPYVALEIGAKGAQRFAFGSPPKRAAVHAFPLRYLDQPLETLSVSDHAANRPFSDSDRAVVQVCAQQIGIALYVAELTAVLQTSREQIIVAREAERRRIRTPCRPCRRP